MGLGGVLSFTFMFLISAAAFADQEVPFVSESAVNSKISEANDGVSLSISIRSKELKLRKEDVPKEAWAKFESLNPIDQTGFLKNRKSILEKFAKAIYYPSLAGGTFVLAEGKIVSLFRKKVEKETPPVPHSISESAEEVRINLVKKVENALWSNLKLVQTSNEFGLHISLGLETIAGAGEKGRGGGISLFINFSYNQEYNAMVFEVGLDREAFHRSPTGILNIAAFWKIYPYIRYVTKDSFRGNTEGMAYYPPGVIGVTSIENDFYGMGFTDSPIGFPSIFAMVMALENSLHRTTLLRIAVSPWSLSVNSVIGDVVSETVERIRVAFGGFPQCASVF